MCVCVCVCVCVWLANMTCEKNSIIDQFLAILPEDMPDLKESTDHLAPLNLRHQFAYYHGGREDKLGFEVCIPYLPRYLDRWSLFSLRKGCNLEREKDGENPVFLYGN